MFSRLVLGSLLVVSAAQASDPWATQFFATLKGIVDPIPMILQGRGPLKAAFTIFATGTEVRSPVETVRGLKLLRDTHGYPIHGIWIETQHIRFSPQEIQPLVALAQEAGFHTFARVPTEKRSDIQGYIDTGVEGIVVPVVERPEQIEEAFDHTYFAAKREAGFSPDLGLLQKTTTDHTNAVDQHKLLAFMIESVKGVDELPQLLTKAVALFDKAGIPRKHGIFWMGPYDLKLDITRRDPAKNADKYVQEAIDKVAAAVNFLGFSMGGHMPNMAVGVERVQKLSFNIFTIAGAADSAYNPGVPSTGELFKGATDVERHAFLQAPRLITLEEAARQQSVDCRVAIASQATVLPTE